MMSVLVNLAGVLLIAAIVWWFWLAGRQSGTEKYGASLIIEVKDGVYEPERIEVPAGASVSLKFLRKDPSPCAEYVVFADLDVSAELAVNKTTEVVLPELTPGEYPFTCQMKMYRGLLVAV